jgi:cyclophilin family peptidyl-prolyl cis-trans isomerase
MRKSLIGIIALVLSTSVSTATVVTMNTTMGNIDIELFDSVAPLTVTNFLNYVQDGDYVNSFIHRSSPGFVIQGGGFQYADSVFSAIPADDPIVNEFSLSNLRGTLAMAKLPGDPDSATSQWFINLGDNSPFLDTQNGGFTVFGRVTGSGMDVVDAIAAIPVYDFTSIDPAFGELPLNGYTGTFDPDNQLIQISNVSISTIPVPAAFWLFGSGLIGLISIARRRKSYLHKS